MYYRLTPDKIRISYARYEPKNLSVFGFSRFLMKRQARKSIFNIQNVFLMKKEFYLDVVMLGE